jgi:hypothetical protein
MTEQISTRTSITKRSFTSTIVVSDTYPILSFTPIAINHLTAYHMIFSYHQRQHRFYFIYLFFFFDCYAMLCYVIV